MKTIDTINLNTYAPRTITLVGKIEYMHRGEVVDCTEYDDADLMIQDVMDELQWGVEIAVTLYRDENGNVPNLEEVECLMQDLRIEDTMRVVRI